MRLGTSDPGKFVIVPEKAPALKALHVDIERPASEKRRKEWSDTYARWCGWCADKAGELNKAGTKWADWNGEPLKWRAIDVERALFVTFVQRPAAKRAGR